MTLYRTAWLGCATAFMALSGAAQAQSLDETCLTELSSLPITLIVPKRPGGGYDTYVRLLAPFFAEATGASVRVTNMPGGGGILAATSVAQQDDDEILIFLEDMTNLANNLIHGDTGLDVADFAPLGILLSEPIVWLARPDLDIHRPLVAAATTLETGLLDIGMAAHAIGTEVQVIAGYDGSSEHVAATMRGEVDFSAPSLGTGLRRALGSDLEIALVVADSEHPDLPGVPALGDVVRASPNGDVEMAEIVVGLGSVHRTLFTVSTLAPDTIACLGTATEIALALPGFVAEAEAQGRAVEPVSQEAAVEIYADVTRAWINFTDASEGILEAIAP